MRYCNMAIQLSDMVHDSSDNLSVLDLGHNRVLAITIWSHFFGAVLTGIEFYVKGGQDWQDSTANGTEFTLAARRGAQVYTRTRIREQGLANVWPRPCQRGDATAQMLSTASALWHGAAYHL